MMQSKRHAIACLVVIGVVLTAACQQRQEGVGERAPGDTLPAPGATPPAPPAGAGPGDTAIGMGGGAEVSVTNTMPHAMIVRMDHGGTPMELGTVGPGETETFDLMSEAGTEVSLTATDSAATHSVEGSVTAQEGEPATWTIQ